MNEYKETYEIQKNILIEAMSKISETDEGKAEAARDIKDLMQKAFKLKHFGEDIKKVYERIEQQKSQMPVYSQGPVHHLRPTSKIKHVSTIEKIKETGRRVLRVFFG